MNILIIEDDKETAKNISKGLIEKGNQAETVDNGIDGLEKARSKKYDVIVMDRMLPGMSGLDIIKNLRSDDIQTPVLILSALGQVNDTIDGLNSGADDYLSKPFDFAELIARLQVLTKRTSATKDTDYILRVASLEMNKVERTVQREGQEITLQPREFNLLKYLIENRGEVVTRKMLLEHIWGYNFSIKTNVVDVHISRLRNKIDKNFKSPIITSIRGSGYTIK